MSIARKRYTFAVSDFGGLDVSKPALAISDRNAIRIKNFTIRDGVIQKRLPWEEMGQCQEITYYVEANGSYESRTNGTKIHDLWIFKGEDGLQHLLAHVGKLIFEVSRGNGAYSFSPIYKSVFVNGGYIRVCEEIVDESVQAFSSGDWLYVLGGTKLYAIRFASANLEGVWASYKRNNCYMAPVESFAYVPVTTVAIVEKDSPISEGNVNLDDVNMITAKRRNRLLTGTISESSEIVRTTRFHEFQLDSDIVLEPNGSTEDISVSLSYREVQNGQ